MSDKYTMFRNYMVNELGITKKEIEEWTKQAVADQVKKSMGQMNLEAIAKREIHETARAGGGYDGLSSLVAREIAKKIAIAVKP